MVVVEVVAIVVVIDVVSVAVFVVTSVVVSSFFNGNCATGRGRGRGLNVRGGAFLCKFGFHEMNIDIINLGYNLPRKLYR